MLLAPRLFLAIDALMGVLFLSISFTQFLACTDYTITIMSRLVSLIVSVIVIYKHRAHGAELITILQSLFKNK